MTPFHAMADELEKIAISEGLIRKVIAKTPMSTERIGKSFAKDTLSLVGLPQDVRLRMVEGWGKAIQNPELKAGLPARMKRLNMIGGMEEKLTRGMSDADKLIIMRQVDDQANRQLSAAVKRLNYS